MLRHATLAWFTSALAGAFTFFASTSVFAQANLTPVSELPPRALVSLGLFGGAIFPSPDHSLISRGTHEAFAPAAPELGIRAAFLPTPNWGLEMEGAAMPTKTASGQGAGLWAGRAHLVGSFDVGRFTPFALVGFGVLGAGSNSMGSDVDPAFHFGIGGRLRLDQFLALRLDLRDTLTQKFDASQGTQTHHPEVLLGLTFSLGPARPAPAPPPPPDADKDGIVDALDKCPNDAGPLPDGCPVSDSDGDGVPDDRDACPLEPGNPPCGCPIHDADGDKVIDELDKCPTVPGPIEGCPDPDPDHDGILGDDDKCPLEPETKNGYEDSDGCPDEIPEKIKKFTGVIKGIEFDLGKETIRPTSFAVIDGAVAVMKEYPALRVEVSGHTDNVGSRDKNLDLSLRRAAAVKAYFVEKTIEAGRIQTRGVGPDEPLADNKTAAGRQKNRRIEFKLLEK